MPRDTFVYFLQVEGGGPIKIGCSRDPLNRLRSLMFWCPYRLMIVATAPGCRIAEAALHERFAADRLHGEWFRPAPALMALIAKVNDDGKLDAGIPNTVAISREIHRGRPRLAPILKRHGISLRELAVGVGSPQGTVNHWPSFLPEHRAVQVAAFLTERGIPTNPIDLYEPPTEPATTPTPAGRAA